jgi:hypothetical protein
VLALRRPAFGALTCEQTSQSSSHHLSPCRNVAMSLLNARCFFDSATMWMRRREERKKETKKPLAQTSRFHGRSCAHSSSIADVASPQWHSPPNTPPKKGVRPTDKSRHEKGSPKTTVEDTRLPGPLSLDPVHPLLGTSDLCLPRRAIHLCDSSTPSAFRRRLRRYVMLHTTYCSAAYGNA